MIAKVSGHDRRFDSPVDAIRLFLGAADWKPPGVTFSAGDIRIVFAQAYRAYVWDDERGVWHSRPIAPELAGKDYLTTVHAWIDDYSTKADLHRRIMVNGVSLWWLRYARMLLDRLERGQVFALIDLIADIAQSHPIATVYVDKPYYAKTSLIRNMLPAVEVIAEPNTVSALQSRSLLIRRVAARALNVVTSALVLAGWLLRPKTDVLVFTSSHYLRRSALAPSSTKQTQLQDVYSVPVTSILNAAGRRVRTIEKDMHSDVVGYSLRHRGLNFVSTDLLSGLATLGRLRPQKGTPTQLDWEAIEQAALINATYNDVAVGFIVVPILKYARVDVERFVHLYAVWLRLLAWLHPRQIIVVCAYYFEAHALIMAARKLGIPSFELQHGIIHAHHLGYMRPSSNIPLGQATKLLVWGSATHDLLTQQGGYDTSEIAVVGNPRLDVYLETTTLQPRLVAAVRQQLGLTAATPIILHTASPETEHFCSKSELVTALAPSLTNAYLVVKVHPASRDMNAWRDAFASAGIVDRAVVLREEIDLNALILSSTVHISFNSTTIIEAAALQRPNLILQFPGALDPVGYIRDGGGVGVGLTGLAAELSRLLADPAQQKAEILRQQAFADKWCHCDGQVMKRIASVVQHDDVVFQ
ncbi:hypothetical protein [Candidatus Chloroploca asiatica]|uniref:UDP-N-acetylglucosamine 2-epimerase domain-containing protein n=1 Tax=Candidatus Chloroploca asiatica TaxID=1506545 RepID=A0A2H3KR44_9CHLR|nr:hypothetical protein [Candidatus Chloroploca asiatica]PDV99982.1 hypothetical protein A9Q02_11145 [Candidatus Chloroploca asiatica]